MRIRNNDLRDILAKFRIRYYRGKGHANLVMHMFQWVAYFGMAGLTVERWFGITLPMELLLLVVPMIPIGYYLLGWYDEKRGIFKAENAYLTRHVNPFFMKLEKNIEEIKSSIKK